MFREMMRNRAILAGLIFFILVVVGSQLYSWHVRRSGVSETERTKQIVDTLNDTEVPRTAEGVDMLVEPEHLGATEVPGAAGAPQSMEAATVLPPTAPEPASFSDASEAGERALTETTESEFPEVPTDYPEDLTPVWVEDPSYQKGAMYQHEMIDRVLIELWNRGDRDFVNGIYDDQMGRVYPLYPDVVYVRWAISDFDGQRYASNQLTTPEVDEMYGDDITDGNIPSHIRVYEFSESGYDPHEFLGLPR